jgi:Big-like domain-containing protein
VKDDIRPIREKLNYDDYMANFESLKSFAESYKKTDINKIQISKDIIIHPRSIIQSPSNLTIITDIRPQIFARFDEDMDEKTINSHNMFVTEDQTKIKLSGLVKLDPKLNAAVFVPTMNLHNSKKYNITISREVKDITGSQLEEDVIWSFFTR